MIEGKEWYWQGTIAIPWFVQIPYQAGRVLFGKDLIVYYKGEDNRGYFNKNVELENAKKVLAGQARDPEHIQNEWHGEWKRRQEALEAGFLDFGALSKAELLPKLKEIARLYSLVWEKAPMIELFDPWGEKLLGDEIGRHGLSFTREEITALTSSLEPTLAQQERMGMYDVIKSGGEGLEAHAEKYCYMQNSWGKGEKLPLEYFKKEMEKYMHDFDALENEIVELRKRLEVLKGEREELYSRKEIAGSLKRFFEMFSLLSHWREERKSKVQLTNYYLSELLKAVSAASGAETELLKFSSPDEIKSLELEEAYLRELEERKKEAVFVSGKWIYGNEAREIIQEVESTLKRGEIKGSPASRGKAQGRVKLVLTYDDFEKVQGGDVLVTPMTRPEHVPLMKKAAAIVTDEGGLTCHAAIVSRELGIPCVVGTQVATISLKDNELVEVDGNSGLVKKLG